MAGPRAIASRFTRRIAGTFDPLLRPRYTEGNRIRLLATPPEFFARLAQGIAQAQRTVHLETYIFTSGHAGSELRAALEQAARRGVEVRVLVDGFGTGESAHALRAALSAAGGQLRVYRPERAWRARASVLRRLHRKMAVIDDRIAFVGGINIEDPPTRDEFTGEAIGMRMDMAVECEGPLVAAVSNAVRRLWWAVGVADWREYTRRAPRRVRPENPRSEGVRAALVLRDNLRHRHSIEHRYRAAIRDAREEILMACAYFLPGRRLRNALTRAARRGVRVRLLLQGRVEYRLQHAAQRALYGQLLAAGIQIHEYRLSYLHAKVAVIDRHWATVGSSNIDPISLLLAREANVVVRDAAFSRSLQGAIESAMAEGATVLDPKDYARRTLRQRLQDLVALWIVRTMTVVLARRQDY
jgi:cardiolipin synthase